MRHSRRPSPLSTCIIAPSVDSSVGFEARTSSHTTRDSSTFCERTRARALRAYSHMYVGSCKSSRCGRSEEKVP